MHSVGGTKQFWKRIKDVERPFNDLNIKEFGHISTRAKVARAGHKKAQLKLHDNFSDVSLKGSVKTLQKWVSFLCKAERKFLVQKPNATLCYKVISAQNFSIL